MPQPLPSELPESLNNSDVVSEIHSAYSRILLLEKAAHSHSNRKIREQKLIYARILGYIIREGPSIRASEHVAKEVISCQNDDQMDKLGEIYYLHYIRAFKRHKGVTPSPSTHPSRPSFETKKEMMKELLRQAGEPPQQHRRGKKNALVRDNFRCIVSGRYDSQSVQANHELKEEVRRSRSLTCDTQGAHIFPQSTNMNVSGSNEDGAKHEYAASVWAIMQCFGYEDLPEKLNGAGIHSLDNIMTLDPSIHTWFDRLQLWFEAMDGAENTYTVRATEETHLYSCKANPITFESTRPDLPLPNPTYLKIHAACCRVAHLSGAGEHMDKILEDLEDIRVLSKDGSSAHILSFALQPYSPEVVVL